VEWAEIVVMGDWESILDAQTVEAERVAKAVAQAEPAETLEAVTAALEAATAMVEARVSAALRDRSDWLDSLEDPTDVAEEAVGPPTSASVGGGSNVTAEAAMDSEEAASLQVQLQDTILVNATDRTSERHGSISPVDPQSCKVYNGPSPGPPASFLGRVYGLSLPPPGPSLPKLSPLSSLLSYPGSDHRK
jgi:hypothetical protein